jgi:hypothetical protein
MYLVWLRVAAVLYAVASLTALPAVLYAFPRWRKLCLPAGWVGVFVSPGFGCGDAGVAHHWVPVAMGRLSRCWAADCGDFFGDWRVYGTVSFGVFALPASFLLVFVPALGAGGTPFLRMG